MGRESKEFEVDGIRFMSNQYGAVKSTKIFAQLVKLTGKTFSEVTEEARDQGLKNALGVVIQSIAEKIDPDTFPSFMESIFADTMIFRSDSFGPVKFDSDFAGKTFTMFKAAKEVLAFNYSDFLELIVSVTETSEKPEATKAKPAIKAV